jgi:hypothetical protein
MKMKYNSGLGIKIKSNPMGFEYEAVRALKGLV